MVNYKLNAFVMMPFTGTEKIRETIREAAFTSGIYCELIDEDHSTGTISIKIESKIRKSDLCICDVSGKNPNVAWEYGFAVASGKKVVLLCQNYEEIYFNIRGNNAIMYDPQDLTSLKLSLIVALNKVKEELTSLPHELANTGKYLNLGLTASTSAIQETPYKIFDVIKSATTHVFMAAQNHGFIWQNSINRDLFRNLVQEFFDKSSNSRFDIMMCDENCTFGVESWTYVLDASSYKQNLNDAVSFFSETKKYFEKSKKYKSRFTVKKFPLVPISLTLIDPDQELGIAILTPNVYQKSNSNKPSFIISKSHDREIFKAYWTNIYTIFTAYPSVEILK